MHAFSKCSNSGSAHFSNQLSSFDHFLIFFSVPYDENCHDIFGLVFWCLFFMRAVFSSSFSFHVWQVERMVERTESTFSFSFLFSVHLISLLVFWRFSNLISIKIFQHGVKIF